MRLKEFTRFLEVFFSSHVFFRFQNFRIRTLSSVNRRFKFINQQEDSEKPADDVDAIRPSVVTVKYSIDDPHKSDGSETANKDTAEPEPQPVEDESHKPPFRVARFFGWVYSN